MKKHGVTSVQLSLTQLTALPGPGLKPTLNCTITDVKIQPNTKTVISVNSWNESNYICSK